MSIGKWLGIPVYIHWSLALVFLLLAFFSPQTLPVYFGLFAIVLLHEFGHCIAAKKYNKEVLNITLYPIGGIASIDINRISPWEEFVITIWGPLVNAILIGPLYLVCASYPNESFETIFNINIAIMLFNVLLPAFPMDGGRILRSILSGYTGNHLWATKMAVRVSQVTSVLMFATGIYYSHLMLVVVAVFVFVSSKTELMNAEVMDMYMPDDFSREISTSSRGIVSIQDRIDEHEANFN